MSLPFYNQFWSFFWPLCNYVSQNLGADCHFVALNLSKSELDQRLQHKFKTFLFPLFSILEEKILKIYDQKMGNVETESDWKMKKNEPNKCSISCSWIFCIVDFSNF